MGCGASEYSIPPLMDYTSEGELGRSVGDNFSRNIHRSERDQYSGSPDTYSGKSAASPKRQSSGDLSTRGQSGGESGGGELDVPAEGSVDREVIPTGRRRLEDRVGIHQAALTGDMTVEYPLTAMIVRIFTSSTFTDTKVERNSLMAKVYPEMRAFCQQRAYEFQVVDMRWGVRDEATDDHMTSALCMNEIKECQRISTGPNFITFLGQKYGYRPFPPKIQAEEFESILLNIENEADSTLLKKWFARDDNTNPPVYQLQPIRTQLVHYADNSDPDKMKQDRDAWWEAFERMQVVLRQGASLTLSEPSDIHKYYWAVTEEEIYNGILQPSDTDTGCFWFKRKIVGLAENSKDKMARRFMDMTGSAADEEALSLLDKLRDEMIPKALPAKNIKEYEVTWTPTGIDPSVSKEHDAYIKRFCEEFEDVLKDMITEGIRLREANEITDSLDLECIHHLQFAQNKCKLFNGRKEFLQTIRNTIDKGTPLVLCGEPGCGKTSLMAKLTSTLPSWYPDHAVITRFLGTTPASSSTRDLLISLCEQINKLNQTASQLPKDMKDIEDYFLELLEHSGRPICLLLDSLDQLRDLGGSLRHWIPDRLQPNVILILSAIPTQQHRVVPQLKKVLAERQFLDVPELSLPDIRLILQEWMKTANRKLQTDQQNIIEKCCDKVRLPLYLKLAFDEAMTWKSYTEVNEIQLGHTVKETIHNLLEKVEKYHGKILVARSLAYLTAAKNGISVSEMEDILSLDEVVLNDVYQYHVPPLRRLPSLLWVRIQADIKDYLVNSGADGAQLIRWYHRQFQHVATERYLSDQDFKKEIHAVMGEYFLGTWSGGVLKPYVDKKGISGEAERFVAAQPLLIKEDGANTVYNMRKLSELPYHLTLAHHLQPLKQHALLQYSFIHTKIKATSLDVALDDFNFALDELFDEEVELVKECLRMSRDALAHDLDLLPGRLTGRLMADDIYNKPAVQRLIDQASRPDFDCLLSTQGHLRKPGGPLVAKLAGHKGLIQSFEINKKGTRLISCCSEYDMILWDLHSGRQVEYYDLRQHPRLEPTKLTAMQFCYEDIRVILINPPWIFVWDLESGLPVHFIDSVPFDDCTGNVGLEWHLWEERDFLFAVIDKDMVVIDMNTGNKMSEISHPQAGTAPTDPLCQHNGKEFVGGFKNYLVVYRKWTSALFISDYTNFPQCSVRTQQVINEDTASEEFVTMSVTSGGLLACFHLVPQRYEADKGRAPDKSTLDVYDIKTASKLHTFPDIKHGLYMNGLEQLLAVDPDGFVFTTHPVANTMIHLCDTKNNTIKQVMAFNNVYLQYARIGPSNKMVISFQNDRSMMELYDMRKAQEATSGGSGSEAISGGSGSEATSGGKGSVVDDVLNPEAGEIRSLLPGSSRYVNYITKDGSQAIWDLATRQCMRWITAGFVSSVFCNMTQMVSSTYMQRSLVHSDVREGTVLHTAPVVYDGGDGQGGVGKVDSERVAFIGPKEYQVSVYNIKTNKIEFTLDGPVGLTLSGLIVSDNGGVAIASAALDLKALASGTADNATTKPSRIYAFDLKDKKCLPDLVKDSKMTFNTSSLRVGTYLQAMLTPDGKHFVWQGHGERGPTAYEVFTVHTGNKKEVPDFDTSFIACLGYCRMMSGVITGDNKGIVRVWNPENMESLSRIEAMDDVINYIYPSHQSPLAGLISTRNRNYITICDLKAESILIRYRSESEISSCLLTPGDRFLLLASRGCPGLVQLCFHSAELQANIPEGATVEHHYLQVTGTEEKNVYGPPKKINLFALT